MAETPMELEPVPRDQWPDFCAAFAGSHRGWLVNVHRVATRRLDAGRDQALAGAETLCREQALMEITDRPAGGGDGLRIAVAADAGERRLVVNQVVRLFDERTAGGDFGLRMDCADGTSTLLEFRVSAEPEAVDGLAAGEL